MDIAKSLEAVNAAHKDAKSRGLGKGSGGYGELLCPVCKTGILKYSVASYNGHIHGSCSTDGCVRWME